MAKWVRPQAPSGRVLEGREGSGYQSFADFRYEKPPAILIAVWELYPDSFTQSLFINDSKRFVMLRRITLATLPLLAVPAFAADAGTDRVSDWKITLGGGIASVPRYEGSSSNRLRGVPVFEAEKGRFFAGVSRGIGYNFSDIDGLQYGLRATLAHARYHTADARLNGMNDITYTGEAGAFANINQGLWYGQANFAASSNGTRAELGAGLNTKVSETDFVRVGATLDWGDSKYNQTYYGVTTAEAAASGNVLTTYNAGSGIRHYGATASWTHSFDKNWFGNITINAKQMAGSAKNSPLTMKSNMQGGAVTVGYRF